MAQPHFPAPAEAPAPEGGKGVEAEPGEVPDAASVAELGAELETLRPVVRAVVAAILRRSVHDADVEDCTHEALHRALEGQARLKAGNRVRPWVLGIARHVALDALRSRQTRLGREARGGADEDGTRLAELLPDAAPNAETALTRAQAARHLHASLKRLPVSQRRAVEMFHLEELSYREIAARLDVPVGTVCTWVARARQSLASALKGQNL